MVRESFEKLGNSIVEIGTSPNKSFIKQYEAELPPNTSYQIVNIGYGALPNEKPTTRLIPLDDASVNEIVLSNVISDMGQLDPEDKSRFKEFWEFYKEKNPGPFNIKEALEYVAYVQKNITIEDIIRVLKQNGIIKIYENYRQFHPNVVSKILESLRNDPRLEFIEDLEEEQRIKPILEKINQEALDFYKDKTHIQHIQDVFIPRPLNKVYKITKK